MSKSSDTASLRCSFCQKNEKRVAKLISTPADYPRAYICDECIMVCASILEDDQPKSAPSEMPHLMEAIERWIREEPPAEESSANLREVRAIATRMLDREGHGSL
jgi:ATP-dependent protease Clp ATPase subunit